MTGPLIIAGAELSARSHIHVLDHVLDDILLLIDSSSFVSLSLISLDSIETKAFIYSYNVVIFMFYCMNKCPFGSQLLFISGIFLLVCNSAINDKLVPLLK